MYFEPLISVKCCPKLHIKQLRNNLHLSVRSGWVGGGVTDEKGGSGKGGGGQDPLTPPSGHAYGVLIMPLSLKAILDHKRYVGIEREILEASWLNLFMS